MHGAKCREVALLQTSQVVRSGKQLGFALSPCCLQSLGSSHGVLMLWLQHRPLSVHLRVHTLPASVAQLCTSCSGCFPLPSLCLVSLPAPHPRGSQTWVTRTSRGRAAVSKLINGRQGSDRRTLMQNY